MNKSKKIGLKVRHNKYLVVKMKKSVRENIFILMAHQTILRR